MSGSYPIWRWLQVYGSVEYQEVHGRSLHGHQKTSLWKIPVNLGLEAIINIYPKMQYYFALGPRYFYVHQHNDSSYVNRNINRNGVGGFANTGFLFLLCRHLVLDVFGEYSYERTHFHSSKTNVEGRHIQIGGFTFGGGLGYAF